MPVGAEVWLRRQCFEASEFQVSVGDQIVAVTEGVIHLDQRRSGHLELSLRDGLGRLELIERVSIDPDWERPALADLRSAAWHWTRIHGHVDLVRLRFDRPLVGLESFVDGRVQRFPAGACGRDERDDTCVEIPVFFAGGLLGPLHVVDADGRRSAPQGALATSIALALLRPLSEPEGQPALQSAPPALLPAPPTLPYVAAVVAAALFVLGAGMGWSRRVRTRTPVA